MSEIVLVFEESDCELLIDVEAMKVYNESWGAMTPPTQKEVK